MNLTISTAYWCILIAAMLPYLWTVIAKSTGTNGKFNNREPRDWAARQDNPRSRWANAAQLNAFESNPLFFASVLMAQFAGLAGDRIGLMAVIYVGARLLHGIFYITGKHQLRSIAWFAGLLAVLYLVVQAAMHIALS